MAKTTGKADETTVGIWIMVKQVKQKKGLSRISERVGGLFLLGVLLFLGTDPVFAEFFKYTDSQGNTAYTNKRAKVPKEFQKSIEVIREKDLPPLKVEPEFQPVFHEPEKPSVAFPSIRTMIFYLPGILGIIAVLYFFMKGFKIPAGRFGLKLLIAGAVTLGLCLFILYQFNSFQFQGTKNPEKANQHFLPMEKIQRKVKKVEENIQKQEEVLESISKE